MGNKNTHREVETKSKIGHETNAFLRCKHPICRRGHHEKRSDYTKASWEVLSSPPPLLCVRRAICQITMCLFSLKNIGRHVSMAT